MATRGRTDRALSILLPAGVLGASAVLAAAQARSLPAPEPAPAVAPDSGPSVAERLQAIRESAGSPEVAATLYIDPVDRILLAQWVNLGGGGVGWRNGGWNNAPWRNAGWRNVPWGNAGWRNVGPWRNAPWANGWNNWRNGPWRNFWRNW